MSFQHLSIQQIWKFLRNLFIGSTLLIIGTTAYGVFNKIEMPKDHFLIEIATILWNLSIWGAIIYIYPTLQHRKIQSAPVEDQEFLMEKHNKTIKKFHIAFYILISLSMMALNFR